MSAPRKKPKPSREPQGTDYFDFWYYEDRRGVHVYADISRVGPDVGTVDFRIPWRLLKASMRRCK